MKTVNSKVLTVIFSAMAIFALSGCGSSGTSSGDELVGGTPVAPPVAPPVTPPVAEAPIVAPSYEITAHHESTVVVHSHVTPSPTGDEHTHQWTQVSGPTVALTTPTAQTTTFVAPTTTQPVVLQHVVHNIDKGTRTSTQHTVMPIQKTIPLSLKLSTHKTVLSGSKVSLHASASGGEKNYTYVWVQRGGTIFTLDLTHPSAPTFTPVVTKTEDLIFELVVIDGTGATVKATETITVTPPPAANTAPVAVATADNLKPNFADSSTDANTTLDGLGSHDTDVGDTLTYAWTVESGPDTATAVLSDATSSKPTLTVHIAGTYQIKLVVNDGKDSSNPVTLDIDAGFWDCPCWDQTQLSGLDRWSNDFDAPDLTTSTSSAYDYVIYRDLTTVGTEKWITANNDYKGLGKRCAIFSVKGGELILPIPPSNTYGTNPGLTPTQLGACKESIHHIGKFDGH